MQCAGGVKESVRFNFSEGLRKLTGVGELERNRLESRDLIAIRQRGPNPVNLASGGAFFLVQFVVIAPTISDNFESQFPATGAVDLGTACEESEGT